jgi:hypothetical protein
MESKLKQFFKTFVWWFGLMVVFGLVCTNSGLGEVLLVSLGMGVLGGLLFRGHLTGGSGGSGGCGGCGGGGCGGGGGGCGGGGGGD